MPFYNQSPENLSFYEAIIILISIKKILYPVMAFFPLNCMYFHD